MRASQWIFSLFLATSLCTASAVAADATPAAGQAPAATLEKIDATPAAAERNKKDCPVPQAKGNKECMHKDGEPCPYNHGDKHHGKSHKKCDYKNQG